MDEDCQKNQLQEELLKNIYVEHENCNLSTSQVLEARQILLEKGFEVIDIIASNQSSLVFKAIHMINRQEAAIKLQVCRNRKVLQEFQNQFAILESIQDINLLKIHEIYFDNQNELLFVVMDLCAYGDLYNFTRSSQELSKDLILDLCASVIRSLSILHSQNIIHGDINTSNFLLDTSLNIKISYQGASKFLYNTLKHAFSDPFSFHYCSKEQFQKEQPSVNSDLYSVGLVLLDLIGLRVDSCINTMMDLKEQDYDKLIKLKERIQIQYQDIFDISLELIQKKERVVTTEQSTIILKDVYNKLITIKNTESNSNKSEIPNYDQQNQKIEQGISQQEIQQARIDQQYAHPKQLYQFTKFIYKTSRQMIKETTSLFIKYFIQFIYFTIQLFDIIKNKKIKPIFKINELKIQQPCILVEDKSVQTIASDESSNNTPAYKRSKFSDNKSFSPGSNSQYNMPIEYEITTQYLDTEDENQDSNKFTHNKIDIDNLSSGESDISLDDIELKPRKSNSQQLSLFHSANQLSVQQTNIHRLSNASTNCSQSDSQVEEKLRDKQDSFSSQIPTCNKSPIIQPNSQQDILFFPNGYYIGEVRNKLPHGQGKMYFHKGNRYEGHFLNGLYEGKGVYYYLGGNKYTGQWKNNLREGHGMYKWANGTIYIGEYKQNSKTGKGTLKFSNGDSYEGCFLENNFHGTGIYRFADGVRFEGEFNNGIKASDGKFYLLNGQVINNQNFRQIPDLRRCQNLKDLKKDTQTE